VKEQYLVKMKLAVLFILLLLGGMLIVQDYGLSVDEPIELHTAELTARYERTCLRKIFLGENDQQTIDEFLNYKDKVYGVAVRLPLTFFFASEREYYYASHMYIYLWFVMAAFCLAYICMQIASKENEKYAYFMILVPFFLPRLFAESFYNIKDNLFYSVFMVSLAAGIWAVKSHRKSAWILSAVLTALCINLRVIGFILLPIVCVMYFILDKSWKRVGGGISYCILTYGLYVLFTPYLWTGPITNFIKIILRFYDFPFYEQVLYRGLRIWTDELPWHYLITWIGISNPVVFLLFCVIGCGFNILLIKTCVKKCIIDSESADESEKIAIIFKLLMLILLLGTLFIDVVLRPIKYDEWRHFRFLYVPMLVCFWVGIDELLLRMKTIKRAAIIGVPLAVSAIASSIWSFQSHPYQYVYFNPLVRQKAVLEYERDYWYIGTCDALKDILDETGGKEANVWFMRNGEELLEDSEQDLIRLCSQDEAEYLVVQYRIDTVSLAKEKIESEYPEAVLIREQCVDGQPIYSIYQK